MSFFKHILLGVFLIGSNELTGAAVLSSLSQVPERKIANYFSDAVGKAFLKPETVRTRMCDHYEYLKLRSSDGKWINPALQNISDMLLPAHVVQTDFQILIEDMATAAEKNPYLHNVLTSLDNSDLNSAIADLKQQIDEIAPDLLTYAMVLENLTKALVNNPQVLASIQLEFDTHAKEKANMSFVHSVKYYSVRAAIKQSLAVHEKGKVPGDFSSFLLPLNIAEASILDVLYGKFGNSQAGWTLIKHGPGDCVDLATGAAPACFNKDKTAIALNMPFSESWANLYAAWNLGFVASLYSFPYHAAKLLIPSVNAFHDEPGLYMYNRVCALYVHAHYVAMRQYNDPKFLEIDFSNMEIAKTFSNVNRRNAELYEAKFNVE